MKTLDTSQNGTKGKKHKKVNMAYDRLEKKDLIQGSMVGSVA
jgi:hypothetical protein